MQIATAEANENKRLMAERGEKMDDINKKGEQLAEMSGGLLAAAQQLSKHQEAEKIDFKKMK